MGLLYIELRERGGRGGRRGKEGGRGEERKEEGREGRAKIGKGEKRKRLVWRTEKHILSTENISQQNTRTQNTHTDISTVSLEKRLKENNINRSRTKLPTNVSVSVHIY